MSNKEETVKVRDVYDDALFVVIGFSIFYLSILGFDLWNGIKDQYYLDHPSTVEGAFTFVSIFLVVPLFTFAGYLILQGINGIIEFIIAVRKGEEEVALR